MNDEIRGDLDKNHIDNIFEFIEKDGVCVGNFVVIGKYCGYVSRIYKPDYHNLVRCVFCVLENHIMDVAIDSLDAIYPSRTNYETTQNQAHRQIGISRGSYR